MGKPRRRISLSLLQESVGKISLCTSQCSPCLRGASFLKQFQHGDTETTESTRRSSIFPTDCLSRVIGGVSQEKGSRLNGPPYGAVHLAKGVRRKNRVAVKC